MNILLLSSTESSKLTGLFISICVCFIPIANSFSVKNLVVWQLGPDTI